MARRIATVTGGTFADPAAADSNTYVRYGTESWNSLVANADITIPGGTFDPEPFEADGSCDLSKSNNWGEPLRSGNGYVPSCVDYFPIIYASGTLRLNDPRRFGAVVWSPALEADPAAADDSAPVVPVERFVSRVAGAGPAS